METLTASMLHRMSNSDRETVRAWIKRFVDLEGCADLTIHDDGWTTFTIYLRNLDGNFFLSTHEDVASMKFPKKTGMPPSFVLEVIERGLSNMRRIEG